MIKEQNTFNIGDRIELIRINTKKRNIYPSQILDILDKEIIVVSGPIYKSEIILIHKDEIIEVSYIIENKGRYSFKAKVLRKEYEKIYTLILQKISNIKRFQLRGFYRLSVNIPVIKKFSIKEDHEQKTISEECRTKDISGGGLKLYSNYQHEVGDIVSCQFNIEERQIEVKGSVVRIEKVDTFDYNYGLGIKFVGLDERDRDKIIQFIFLKQRLLREKGLI